MKFFTEEWCSGKLKTSETKKVARDYQAYLDEIYDELPFPIKLLAKHINLHDGILGEIQYSKSSNMLILNGSFGDLETGYFSLQLKYLGISNFDLNQVASLCKNQKLEILRDEIELLTTGGYSHRLFFAIKKELEIFFRNLEIEIKYIDAKDYYKICSFRLA